MASIAERMGHRVSALTNDYHISKHRFINKIGHLLTKQLTECDIYIAKSDAFYVDSNWDQVKNINAFKVCLCNSDKCFRESSDKYGDHVGNPVQDRCDLYMPVNHSTMITRDYAHKMIPAAHPIDPRMYKVFCDNGVLEAYFDDDVEFIRDKFKLVESFRAGFMGNDRPLGHRRHVAWCFPEWVDFNWTRNASSVEYIKWIMQRRGCVDLRGYGDKSIRFVEAVLFGKTIIAVETNSLYSPMLINNYNCILTKNWHALDLKFDAEHWLQLSEAATKDYREGWSLRAQLNRIIARATLSN